MNSIHFFIIDVCFCVSSRRYWYRYTRYLRKERVPLYYKHYLVLLRAMQAFCVICFWGGNVRKIIADLFVYATHTAVCSKFCLVFSSRHLTKRPYLWLPGQKPRLWPFSMPQVLLCAPRFCGLYNKSHNSLGDYRVAGIHSASCCDSFSHDLTWFRTPMLPIRCTPCPTSQTAPH